MAGNQGKLGNELSFVDVQIGTTDTARLYSDTPMLLYNRTIGDELQWGDLP